MKKPNDEVIEYATSEPTPSDDRIRQRARNAPAAIKRSMDAARAARGALPLWEKASKRSARPPVRPTAAKVVLFGHCTPGTSLPVKAATDGLLLPERFERGAFRSSLAAVAAGTAVVELRDGHDGRVVATTSDGTLLLTADTEAGIAIEGTITNSVGSRRLIAEAFSGAVGLSVGFRPRRVEIVGTGARRVRVIHEASVHHIALIRPEHGGVPAYPSRVRACMGTSSTRIAIGRGRAFIDAMRELLRQEGRKS